MTDITVLPRPDKDILKDACELDDVAYDQQRDVLAKGLGIRASTLDAQRKSARKELAEDENQTLFLRSSEPCAEPVDGTELLNALVTVINEYLILPEGAAEAMALWTLHTYCHDAAWIDPLLAVLSPTKRCGKTTAMNLLGSISDKPLLASNCTSATLFRGIEKYKPTLLLDEAETFITDNEEMRGVINSGHNRASAQILRAVPIGDSYDVKPFSTWCPKAIACIGKLPSTLMDRAIVVWIQRKKKADKVRRLRGDKLHEFEPIRRRCARWALDNLDAIKAIDPDVPDYLGDRASDNWRTLLAIANVAGWTEPALTAIRQLTPEKTEDDDTSVKLLADIRDIFEEKKHGQLLSADIVEDLNEMEERPWPGFYRGKGFTVTGMARMLGKYEIRPKLSRSLGSKRGYKKEDFIKVWSLYLPDPGDSSATPLQTNNDGAFSNFPAATSGLGVALEERPEPPPNKGCNTVALGKGGYGEKSVDNPDIAKEGGTETVRITL